MNQPPPAVQPPDAERLPPGELSAPLEPPPAADRITQMSPAQAERFLRLWGWSLDFVESYLESVRSKGALQPNGDSMESVKDQYERWRVFCFAVGCLKRIQDGHNQSVSEADHGSQPDAEVRGRVSDQFAKEIDQFAQEIQEGVERMRSEGGAEDSEAPLPS